MKVKYLAALAAASVFGMTTLVSCSPEAEVETDATTEDVSEPCAADPCAVKESAEEPCAADPCATEEAAE